MAQPLTIPGTSLVPVTSEKLEQIKKAVEHLKGQGVKTYSLGQIDDQRVGMKALPKKPEPERLIPDFPLHTYNFLKRYA